MCSTPRPSGSVPSRCPSFDVFDIGEDCVAGLWNDEFDVERVRAFGPVRAGSRAE